MNPCKLAKIRHAAATVLQGDKGATLRGLSSIIVGVIVGLLDKGVRICVVRPGALVVGLAVDDLEVNLRML